MLQNFTDAIWESVNLVPYKNNKVLSLINMTQKWVKFINVDMKELFC